MTHRNADEMAIAAPLPDEDLIRLDDALTRLAELHPTKAKLIELRFFGGFTIEQAAEQLDFSPATANREWRSARAWLLREIEETEK